MHLKSNHKPKLKCINPLMHFRGYKNKRNKANKKNITITFKNFPTIPTAHRLLSKLLQNSVKDNKNECSKN